MKDVDIDLEGSDFAPLEILLQLLLGKGLGGGIDRGIGSLGDDGLFDDITSDVKVGFALVIGVEFDFPILSDRIVVTLESVGRVVTDPFGEGFSDGGDEFVTGDEVDTGEGRAESLEGTKVGFVETEDIDPHDQIVAGGFPVLIGVGETDEPTTGLEGFLDGGGKGVEEDVGLD